jgi:acetolactate synthase-1/2/3 large subunit
MILITGQKGILSSKQARFQIVDVVSSMTPLTENKRVLVDELRKRVPAAIA